MRAATCTASPAARSATTSPRCGATGTLSSICFSARCGRADKAAAAGLYLTARRPKPKEYDDGRRHPFDRTGDPYGGADSAWRQPHRRQCARHRGVAQILDRDPRLQAGRLLEAPGRQDALLFGRSRRPNEPPRHRAVREPEPAEAACRMVDVRPAGRDQPHRLSSSHLVPSDTTKAFSVNGFLDRGTPFVLPRTMRYYRVR